jgi:hypothetical protein
MVGKAVSRLAKRLAANIKRHLDIDVIPEIHRTRAGYWQRACGAWSWYMVTSDSQLDIGSCSTATECAKATEMDIVDDEICISTGATQ